ncbi:MAG: bifunctional DNA-formamidopyrimidine glycosylase/DNA-(apurinic or apyrimidinic site) lyase [Betaproteobacteria bacterium]|nr:MAG: bifunctional DNA-formamidopyrimidine glycosylase/DNA-(apurinic or apyrimidinic site) lyase [Betaproteobacteria bacterium]
MPELPEVETTRRGLAPHLVGRRIDEVVIRNARLRWPIAADFRTALKGQRIRDLRRRAKYLIMDLDQGAVIVHLGMSGALSLVAAGVPAAKHDHVDVVIEDGRVLRLTDPRRFGSVHYVHEDPDRHALLASLGPEPLSLEFNGRGMYALTRGRRASVKETLMNARVVAGVGNIYANEALFRARIHPRAPAGRISLRRYEALVTAVRETLADAIRAGGSSLRDWHHADGSLGYFQQQYFVYDRRGEPCRRCGASILELRLGQRATYFCPRCQRR